MSDPLADVLRDVPGRPTVSGDYYLDMARTARDYFINQIEDEIEDIDRCGDEGMPPARAGLTRAIGIINRGRND